MNALELVEIKMVDINVDDDDDDSSVCVRVDLFNRFSFLFEKNPKNSRLCVGCQGERAKDQHRSCCVVDDPSQKSMIRENRNSKSREGGARKEEREWERERGISFSSSFDLLLLLVLLLLLLLFFLFTTHTRQGTVAMTTAHHRQSMCVYTHTQWWAFFFSLRFADLTASRTHGSHQLCRTAFRALPNGARLAVKKNNKKKIKKKTRRLVG